MSETEKTEVELTWDTLPDIVKTGLIQVATEHNFVTYQVDLEPGSKLGDGFMSIILRATINGTKGVNGEEIKNVKHSFPVLCKMQVHSKIRREMSNTSAAFQREVLVYTEFLPAIESLQKEHGIAYEDGFYYYPKCFYAKYDQEKNDGVLILQDMRDQGYQLGNKFQPLDVETCRLVMQGLGRLHALTFAIKVHKPDVFEKVKKCEDILVDVMTKKEIQSMWDLVFTTALNALGDSHPKITEKVKHIRENLKTIFQSLVGNEISGNSSVILHGDSWTNNFLFKSTTNTKYDAVIFIDWQITRYASPVLDIVYFLFNCTDKNTRDNEYENLLHIYHDSFSTMLKRFKGDPDYYFSYEKLKEHLKIFGKYGLIMSICLVPFTTIPAENLTGLDEAMESLSMENNENNSMFKAAEANSKVVETRVRDIILDMDRLGYI